MTRDYSNYGSKIEQIRGEGFVGDSGRPRIVDETPCMGIVDGEHCNVRVSCLRYQNMTEKSVEFVRVNELKANGCEKYEGMLPGKFQEIVNGLKPVETPFDYEEWR